jgi:hypothetical protein
VLGYGESQFELFAKGELKKVAFLSAEVDAQAVKRYRPGAKP